jgi:hypothetical protein
LRARSAAISNIDPHASITNRGGNASVRGDRDESARRVSPVIQREGVAADAVARRQQRALKNHCPNHDSTAGTSAAIQARILMGGSTAPGSANATVMVGHDCKRGLSQVFGKGLIQTLRYRRCSGCIAVAPRGVLTDGNHSAACMPRSEVTGSSTRRPSPDKSSVFGDEIILTPLPTSRLSLRKPQPG